MGVLKVMNSSSEAASDFLILGRIAVTPSLRNAHNMGGFPNFRGTIFGVPITRTVMYWRLYIGVPLFPKTTISQTPVGQFRFYSAQFSSGTQSTRRTCVVAH